MKATKKPNQNSSVVEQEIRQTQALALAHVQASAIQTLGTKEALEVQRILQHGEEFGWWDTPHPWHPGGADSVRHCNLRQRLLYFLEQELGQVGFARARNDVSFEKFFDEALLSMVRYLIVCRCGPASLRPLGSPVKPSNLAHLAYQYLPHMAALSVVKALAGDEDVPDPPAGVAGGCFYRLLEADFNKPHLNHNRTGNMEGELARMRYLHTRNLWVDAPALPDQIRLTNSAPHATKVRGVKKRTAVRPPTSPHLPFPDEWVSEMGQKSAWLIEHLAPNLLRCVAGFKQIWKEAAAVNLSESRLSARCTDYLGQFAWNYSHGAAMNAPPFRIAGFSDVDEPAVDPNEELTWPPRTFQSVMVLVQAVQGAHLFVAGMATAPRTTETITSDRDCVVVAKNNRRYWNGKTYKLVRVAGGIKRDWILPEFTELAIKQQAELVALYECLSPVTELADPDSFTPGTHLWGNVGRRNRRAEPMGIDGPNILLRHFAASLGMDLNPGGQLIRHHRFRKTLARITALAVTNAPKILMDVLGHKSVENTLYYILTDKDLQADVEVVARELRVLRCETLLKDLVAQEQTRAAIQKAAVAPLTTAGVAVLGGPAAARVERALKLDMEAVHQRGEDYGAANLRELAESFTMQGRFWEQVRPGVLCTKTADQFGACTGKRGDTDHSNCQTGCDHHLEDYWRKDDVDQSIALAVQYYGQELEQGQDLVASLWAGQIRTYIDVFPDVRAKWFHHPIVAAILAEGTEG